MGLPFAKRLISVKEYHLMAEAGILKKEDRIELIQGEIIHMSPIGSKHAGQVNRLVNLLASLLFGKVVVTAQNPVQLNDFSEPEPDIAILKYRKDYYSEAHPKPEDVYILIEVANSSLDYDHDIKLPNYALAEIPEYWIVDIENGQIEVYRQPKNGGYSSRQTFFKEDKIEVEPFGIQLLGSDILGE